MKEFHFFASSCAEWATTTPLRELPDLINLMEKAGYVYRLWMVPGPWTDHYSIEHYSPVVEGAVYLGQFDPPETREVSRKAQGLQKIYKALDKQIRDAG